MRHLRHLVGLAAPAAVLFVLVCPAIFALPVEATKQRVYVIAAVGDISMDTDPGRNPGRCQYDDVAELIYGMNADRFLMLGDGQHNDGELRDYLAHYDKYFDRLRDITAPVPGNHDYYASDTAQGYFEYFGDLAHGPLGFYSFDLGSWHIIALNSQLGRTHDYTVPGTPAHAQYQWLLDDLESHPNTRYKGTIAFMHHPYYDWETYSSASWFQSWDLDPQRHLWEALDSAGVDVVLAGHNHNYQRWAPMDADGNYDPEGIREFIVGTGGAYVNSLGHPPVPQNLEQGLDSSFGALRITLYDDATFDIEFVSTDGTVLDSVIGLACR